MNHIKLFVLLGLLVVLMAVSPGCASTAKPMLFESLALGSAIGATVSLAMGAAPDVQRRHETDSGE